MKDQYFGDINDYRKYGLLRCLMDESRLSTLISWMLTPNDGSTHGKFTEYLSEPKRWRKYDPVLYEGIFGLVSSGEDRSVGLIERSDILNPAQYYSDLVPDSGVDRNAWFSRLLKQAESAELVFLDPDNGLEIKSKPYGRKQSSKFLYWREVEALWFHGKSLLIYQHFIREKRTDYIKRMLTDLETATPRSLVEAFSTPNVVFLLALQPEHQHHHGAVVDSVQSSWTGQILHWELTRSGVHSILTVKGS